MVRSFFFAVDHTMWGVGWRSQFVFSPRDRVSHGIYGWRVGAVALSHSHSAFLTVSPELLLGKLRPCAQRSPSSLLAPAGRPSVYLGVWVPHPRAPPSKLHLLPGLRLALGHDALVGAHAGFRPIAHHPRYAGPPRPVDRGHGMACPGTGAKPFSPAGVRGELGCFPPAWVRHARASLS